MKIGLGGVVSWKIVIKYVLPDLLFKYIGQRQVGFVHHLAPPTVGGEEQRTGVNAMFFSLLSLTTKKHNHTL